MRKLIVFLGLLLLVFSVQAQRWSMSAGAGGTIYKGDLSDWHLLPAFSQWKTTNTAINFQLRYQPKQAFAYRAKLTFTGIDGDGANDPKPTVSYSTKSFSSPLIELAGLVDYNFKDYQANRNIRNWTPFVYGGLGFLFVSPESPMGPNAVPNPQTFFTWAIPFGVGVKAALSDRLGLQWEFGTSKSLTNILDGMPAWGDQPKTITLNKTDQYLHSSVSITYSLISVYCPRD
ncbi:DUF6089 family protein [Aquirufa sp. 5-AUSEE-100C1]|jgi:hypothetical protein